MKIYYILSHESRYGGTPLVVNTIARFFDSKIIYGKGPAFFKTLIYPFIIPFKLLGKNIDIIHIHDTEGYGCTFFRSLRKKTVYTAHGLWDTYIEKTKPGFFKGLKLKIAAKMQARIIKKSAKITAVSNSVKAEIMRHYKIPSEKITVIYNGVDTKKFIPTKNKKTNTAIWVGDNPKLKNLDKAIEYCNEHKMKLLVVGINGKDEENIKFLGKIHNDRMPEIYNKGDVLLFFSKMEGHPLVPLEAMACGLNVIASKESNIEIIPKRKDGNYFIDGKKARSIVRKYDWKMVAKKYKEIYKNVISSV